MGLLSNGWLLAFPINNRLDSVEANTLANHNTATITTVKKFYSTSPKINAYEAPTVLCLSRRPKSQGKCSLRVCQQQNARVKGPLEFDTSGRLSSSRSRRPQRSRTRSRS
jgi:hypothetical protein